MIIISRRRFLEISTASLLGTRLLKAAPVPVPQEFFENEEAIQNSPYASAIRKLQAMTSVSITSWKWHADNVPHPEDPSLNDADWQLFTLPPEQRGREYFEELRHSAVGNGPIWFRKWVEIPQAMGGYHIQGLPVKLDLRVLTRSQGSIRVFSNGSMVEMTQSDTQQPILLMEKARPGTKVLIAAYAPGPGIIMSRLQVDYPPEPSNPQTMFQEILCVQAASKGFPEGQSERSEQLSAAIQAIDFGALDKGDQDGFNRSLTAADGKMQPLAQWIRQFTIRAVGNAHIDLAWLWPWEETVEVVRDTFGTVLELQAEYPHLYYAQSTAQDFLWLERYYPPEFEKIQQGVKDGLWEMVGGMWCEPDLNMPCGESLVRQLLTGKQYFQKKFGVDVKIGWNPDSFGYSWQLPQIYKRSGVDYFVTQKMSWNDTCYLPYKLFHWESPDGSRVLTYFPHDYVNPIDPVQDSGYIAEDTPLCSGVKQQMLLYGMGDHGGGPTREMLDAAMRWLHSPNAAFPALKMSTAQEFFDEVNANLSSLNLPVWASELYLQFHRGTYTTQAESKKRMRESEVLLLQSEAFCSLAMLDGRAYPERKFEDCWRRVCFDQFHDMMAGSGIHCNYVDEAENLEFVRDALTPEFDDSLRQIAARVDTRGPGVPVVVFNPLSWQRTDVAEAVVRFSGPVAKIEVRDPEGNVMPSAEVSREDSTTAVRVRFLARAVPAIGYKVFHIVSTDSPQPAESTLKANGLAMENEFLRVEVDSNTGCVSSLVSKKDGRNILRSDGHGNLLETFVDKPKEYEAWNIGWPYDQTKTELLEPEDVKLVENTPVRAVIRVRKKFQDSTFTQDICMYPEIARSDVNMHVDWHEHRIMLKVAFPLAIAPLNATYEIPYGTIERPAIPHVPGKPPVPFTEATEIKKGPKPYDPLLAQEAEFEVCAQRWGDLSENGRGFSLLNKCKFGYDTVEKGTIRLTLLRSPESPEPSKDPDHPFADQGLHDFTYSMYPHAGGWREAGTELAGYELNYPLLARPAVAHEGGLASSHSFASIEPANVILTAIKKAEGDNSVIFRFYEFEGKDSQVTLTLPQAATSAVETNLMEKEEMPLSLREGSRQISTSIGHYEIKTVKVRFPDAAHRIPPRRV
jgi:alpha-mannosidase